MPPLCCRATSPQRASTRQWTRSTRPRACCHRLLSARSTTRWLGRCSRSCSATRRCKTSSRFSVWMNCPKKTNSRSPARGKLSASCRNRSTSPKCSPVHPASWLTLKTPSRASRVCARASLTTCQRPPSTWLAPSKRRSRRARNSRRRLRNNGTHQQPRFISALFHQKSFLFFGDVEQVDVPGAEGEFGVLANHVPLVAALRPGHFDPCTVRARGAEDRCARWFCRSVGAGADRARRHGRGGGRYRSRHDRPAHQ